MQLISVINSLGINFIRLSFVIILMTFELTLVLYVMFYSGPSGGNGGGS